MLAPITDYFGIDEAGRGPIVGPVYAAICQLKKENIEINDSKVLSEKKREELYKWIVDNSYYGFSSASHEEIDKINILQAVFLAVNRAWIDLQKRSPVVEPYNFVMDGNQVPPLEIKDYTIKAVPRADGNYMNVSAASIIAKVEHDHFLMSHPECEKYRWQLNKGYGTKAHIMFIKQYGYSSIHRKTFQVKGLYRFGFGS